MSMESVILLVVGVVGAGLISWLVQHLYAQRPTRLLRRIDSRQRTEFVERRDPRAKAAERPDGIYGLDYSVELGGGQTSPTGALSARVFRADGSVEDLGVISR